MRALFGIGSKKKSDRKSKDSNRSDEAKESVQEKLAAENPTSQAGTTFKANASLVEKKLSTSPVTKGQRNAGSSDKLPTYPIEKQDESLTSILRKLGQNLSSTEVDSRLGPIFLDAIDYLANEGLSAPNLFRYYDPQPEICELLIQVIKNSGQLDFVKLNSVSLTTSIFMQCLMWFNLPVLPVALLDSLFEALRKTQRLGSEKQAAALRSVITRSDAPTETSPHLQNVLALFNLVLLYSDSNNASLDMIAQTFAPFLLERGGHEAQRRAAVPNAESVLKALIANVYQIFPAASDVSQVLSVLPAHHDRR